MTERIHRVMRAMILLYAGDPKRIQHFTKVHAYAALIGREEQLDNTTQEILEIAALTHDIGIHACEQQYGQCGGKLQEREGPAIARPLLEETGIPAEIAERVCFLIAHHHTYTGVDAADWQILLEADFLVNAYEDGLTDSTIQQGCERVFKTPSGTALCRHMFGLHT